MNGFEAARRLVLGLGFASIAVAAGAVAFALILEVLRERSDFAQWARELSARDEVSL